MGRKVILASGSENRRVVMESLNIPFEVIAPDIDEKSIRDEDLAVRAEKIARAKGEKIFTQYPKAVILAGDSFAENRGQVFEKPSSIEEAKKMLQNQSGGTGKLYVGFCYIDRQKDINFSTTITIDFKIRELTDSEIKKYVDCFPVLTWSGAMSPQNPYSSGMIESINGSFATFIYGFPIDLVIKFLRKSEFDPHPQIVK